MSLRRLYVITGAIAIIGLLFLGLFAIFIDYPRLQSTVNPVPHNSVGRLSVKGSQILDPSGNPIVLTGFNWSPPGLFNVAIGPENAAQGANVARIAVNWWGVDNDGDTSTLVYNGQTISGRDSYDANSPQTGYIDPTHLGFIDQEVQTAVSAHLWVDLYLRTDCGQGAGQTTVDECGPIGANGRPPDFSTSPLMLARAKVLLTFLANRYANTAYIGMIEPLSEPSIGCTGPVDNRVCDYAASTAIETQFVDAVHNGDPRIPVLVGPDHGYDVTKIDTAYIATTTPVIYTGNLLYRVVQRANYDIPTLVSYLTNFEAKYNAPVFVQQVSVDVNDPEGGNTVTSKLLSALSQANIGWTWWSYRGSAGSLTQPMICTGVGGAGCTPRSDFLNIITSYFAGNERKGSTATQLPTPPGNLTLTKNLGAVTLTWNASVATAGVADYKILRDGSPVGVTSTTSYTDKPGAGQHSYTIESVDRAGNISVPSAAVKITTTQ